MGRLLSKIPPHIDILIIPGNHDAVRIAEPQPTFPSDLSKLIKEHVPHVRLLGNPTIVELDGVNILAYHGRSMDDLLNTIPGLTYENPLEAMKIMLQKRHLAPIYGGRTTIAPENEDHLVIKDIPDIFATGHVHSTGAAKHKGILLVNASTWQSQTEFQRMRNFNPDPAKAVLVNLKTFDFMTLAFT